MTRGSFPHSERAGRFRARKYSTCLILFGIAKQRDSEGVGGSDSISEGGWDLIVPFLLHASGVEWFHRWLLGD